MTSRILPLLILMSAAQLFAQPVKKYVMIEHFTNSVCSICKSRNPAFYTLINQYPNDVHHLSVHPMQPYPSCVFYQANPTENNARANYFNIFGTPTIFLNGESVPSGSQLLPPAVLQAALTETSPLYVQVSETNGTDRTVTVRLYGMDQMPAGNFRLHVAVAEKLVNQTTPNGETMHRDVFRDMLTDINGVPVNLPASGQFIEFTYPYTIPANWNANEMFALAWVQEFDTKEVLNSGTRFDPVLVKADEPALRQLSVSPNPVGDVAWIDLPGDEAVSVRMFDAQGRQVLQQFSNENNRLIIPVAELPRGLYWVHIQGANQAYLAKLVKG